MSSSLPDTSAESVSEKFRAGADPVAGAGAVAPHPPALGASRVVVILVGVPLVFALLAAGDVSRLLFFALLSVLGQFELFSFFPDDGVRHPLLEYILGGTLLTLTFFLGESGLLLGASLAVMVPACAAVLRGLNGRGYRRFALGVSSLLYLPFCLSFFLLLAHQKGYVDLFGVLVTIWALDTGAFLVGCSLGGPKLAPSISPKKTVSGAIGGGLCCLATVLLLSRAGLFQVSPVRLLAFGLLAGTIGQIADLFESVLKREAGVKDAGNLLGGHGGILDRLDSVLFLGPISYFLLGK